MSPALAVDRPSSLLTAHRETLPSLVDPNAGPRAARAGAELVVSAGSPLSRNAAAGILCGARVGHGRGIQLAHDFVEIGVTGLRAED
jgi:hypothetical protein